MTLSNTVLIVEDEYLIATDMEQLLVDMGYAPVIAVSVDEARTVLDKGEIAFAVLDRKVGTSDTLPLGEQLSSEGIPYFYCSGSEVGEDAKPSAVVPFLAKPYTVEAFQRTVDRVVEVPSFEGELPWEA